MYECYIILNLFNDFFRILDFIYTLFIPDGEIARFFIIKYRFLFMYKSVQCYYLLLHSILLHKN